MKWDRFINERFGLHNSSNEQVHETVHLSSWHIPSSGRVHETVRFPANSDKRAIAALRYYLNGLCLCIENNVADIQIINAILRIGEDIQELKNPQDIKDFKQHVFRLQKSREEIFYTAEYHYRNEKPARSNKRSRNPIVYGEHLPIFTLSHIPAYGFIYDKNKNSWILIGQDKETEKTVYDHQALKPLGNGVLPEYADWHGIFRMELRWPKATEAQLEEQIQNDCISISMIPGITTEKTDFAGRHFICESDKHLTGAALQKLVDLLRAINEPICQANGRNKMNGWFVPESTFESNARAIYYLSLSCRVTGQMEIGYFTYE